MKYGVREICNVFVKAKVNGQKVGNKEYKAGQPVCHFDSLKTSTVEGAATTVYATGGRGNPRLMSWDGERTLTFTMEDALISEVGIALLTGAGLINAKEHTLYQHVTLTGKFTKTDSKLTLNDSTITLAGLLATGGNDNSDYPVYIAELDSEGSVSGDFMKITEESNGAITLETGFVLPTDDCACLIDGYIERDDGLMQIDIEPGKFGGNYYFEAETLFRTGDGSDVAAEFIIPNGKIQSNFTFSMASSGDPSTFTFTVDAFPGVTKSDPTKKVLASIQVATSTESDEADSYPNNQPSPKKTTTPTGGQGTGNN